MISGATGAHCQHSQVPGKDTTDHDESGMY